MTWCVSVCSAVLIPCDCSASNSVPLLFTCNRIVAPAEFVTLDLFRIVAVTDVMPAPSGMSDVEKDGNP